MILFLEEHSMRKTCGNRIRVEEMHKYTLMSSFWVPAPLPPAPQLRDGVRKSKRAKEGLRNCMMD